MKEGKKERRETGKREKKERGKKEENKNRVDEERFSLPTWHPIPVD